MKNDDSTAPATKKDLRLVNDRLRLLEKGQQAVKFNTDFLAQLGTKNGTRLDTLEDRFDGLEERMDSLEEKMEKGFSEIRREFLDIKVILKPLVKHVVVIDEHVDDHEKRLQKIGA